LPRIAVEEEDDIGSKRLLASASASACNRAIYRAQDFRFALVGSLRFLDRADRIQTAQTNERRAPLLDHSILRIGSVAGDMAAADLDGIGQGDMALPPVGPPALDDGSEQATCPTFLYIGIVPAGRIGA
jgi:hypothetical protein